MNPSFYIMLSGLIYAFIISISYFSKKRIDTSENRLYSALIITSICGLILDMLLCFNAANGIVAYSIFNYVINKIYLIYCLTWITIFNSYTYVISFNGINKEKITKLLKKIIIIVWAISALIIMILPIYFNEPKEGEYYSYGPSSTFSYVIGAIFIILSIVYMFSNYKHLKNKKYL